MSAEIPLADEDLVEALADLHVDVNSENGDVVRVWQTRPHTIYGLDSASATTLPDDAETLIVTGAAGVATQERQLEEASRYVPRKLRDWAEQRLREFERGLARAARRHAARHSGLAEMPALDRWDDGSGWW